MDVSLKIDEVSFLTPRIAAAEGRPGIDLYQLRPALFREIGEFVHHQLGMQPRAIEVDMHADTILITLTGVLSSAELYAAQEKRIAGMIVQEQTLGFKAVQSILISRCGSVLGVVIQSAAFLLDTETNCASIILTIEKKTRD